MAGFLFAILCLVWSTTWAAIRICERGYPPLWGAAARFVLASVVLGLWLLASRRKSARPGWAALRLVVLAGVVNSLSYGLIYFSELRLTGGTAAVLGAVHPFSALGVAIALGYERPRSSRVEGLLIGLSGVVVVMWAGVRVDWATASAMGAMLFAAAVLWPTYNVLLRRAGDAGVGVLTLTTVFVSTTAVGLLAGALAIEGVPHFQPTLSASAAVLYLAVFGTVLAWAVFSNLLRRLPMSVLATMVFVEPLLALGLDRLLGERVQVGTLWGGILILAGVILAGRHSAEEAPGPVPSSDAAGPSLEA